MIMVDGQPIGSPPLPKGGRGDFDLKDRFTAIKDLVRAIAPGEPDPEIEKGIGYLMMAYVTLQKRLSALQAKD